tara:strand:+ start:245 stop:481 length:237 start_codon:yes stop_codon:yes gene_type:complete
MNWIKISKQLPKPFENIIFYLDELDEVCVGYFDDSTGWLVVVGCEELKPDEEPFFVSSDLVSCWSDMPLPPQHDIGKH